MIGLITLIVLYHLYHFWLRNILFYSKPKVVGERDHKVLRSPCCGRVVYCDTVSRISNRKMIKQGREIECPYNLKDGVEYIHIGIFMSPYNNHHLVSMNNDQRILTDEFVKGTWNEMWSSEDTKKFTDWWKNWFQRKVNEWIEYNARTVFTTSDGIVFCIIYDKWVNKLTFIKEWKNGRQIIGFVHRGSQTDIFIEKSKIDRIVVNPGDKVNFNSTIGVLK